MNDMQWTDQMINELALTSPWDRELAKAVVDGCAQRGLNEDQTRSFCQLALESGLNPGALWAAMETSSLVRRQIVDMTPLAAPSWPRKESCLSTHPAPEATGPGLRHAPGGDPCGS